MINRQGNKKKISRCMIDQKIPERERDCRPLIVCGDEVLWMVGYRISEGYKITPHTRKVLILEYQGGQGNE